eukprot:14713841-Ditylum_brightwellii.AAC.1
MSNASKYNLKSFSAAVGSISAVYNLSPVSGSVIWIGSPCPDRKSISRASPSECAGLVDMTNTRASAS